MFLVFEGLDGSGSTTQAALLVKNLQKKGITAFHTSEPSEDTIGLFIRSALQKEWTPAPEALQLLFTADRAHHIANKIDPSLLQGATVVCDRYIWSTLAYGALSCDQKWLSEINRTFRAADYTFFLDVPVKDCLQRIEKRGKKNELFEEHQKLQKVRDVFLKLQSKDPHSVVLDGTRSIEDLGTEIFDVVEKKFSLM